MRAGGFAIIDIDGTIDVNTVAKTERAAIVNWLSTQAGLLIFDSQTDKEIENIFNRASKNRSIARPMRVTITTDPLNTYDLD